MLGTGGTITTLVWLALLLAQVRFLALMYRCARPILFCALSAFSIMGLCVRRVPQNAAHAILIAMSKQVPEEQRFFSSTAVLLSEAFKFTFALVFLVYEGGVSNVSRTFVQAKTWKSSWALWFPAAVYTFQNNLSFFALSHISAANFQLWSQAKVFTTAIFSVTFLNMRLSKVKWLALVLLVCGVIMAQLSSQLSSECVSTTPIPSSGSRLPLVGVLATVCLTVLSGAAGVYQVRRAVCSRILYSLVYSNIPVHFMFLSLSLACAGKSPQSVHGCSHQCVQLPISLIFHRHKLYQRCYCGRQ
jgi:drug/metabolite transporter (DMT)-like permease